MKKRIIVVIILIATVSVVFGQETLTVKIVDNEGNPVPGVSVQIKGRSNGTVSNANGSFAMEVNDGDVIVLNSIGMKTKEIKVPEFRNIRYNIDTGLITTCCTNHSSSHCAITKRQREKLTEQYGCKF